MKKFLLFTLACALIATLVPTTTAAALVVYDDKAVFTALPGVAPEAAIPNSGLVASPANVGNLQFSLGPGATQLFLGTGNASQWSTVLVGNDVALSAFEDMNVINTAIPIYALGFDFHEPTTPEEAQGAPWPTDVCNTAVCVDSTFTVTLKFGAATVGSFTFNADDDVAAFVGVRSTSAFDTVEIRETTGGIDNEFYGQFYTSSIAPVPEPSTLLMLGSGLVLAFAFRRRR
jgi:hypothetical protein